MREQAPRYTETMTADDSAMTENGLRGETGTMRVKSGLAEMLKGGVIMDVVNAEQAVIAENAGACAVMALERVPADIRRDGGVARMSDPGMIREIQEAVSIPVMAKCRIGHFAEAQILQALEIDYIDESEVLTPADIEHHVDKWGFKIPFVCGATNLGEALRRINEGAAMIRTKGEAGTGDVVNAVTHMRAVFGGIRRLQSLRSDELYTEAKNLQAPVRARALGGGERPAAGRHVHRGRHRHPGGRVAVHAARRRRRLRRLGHLQVGRPRPAREGDRRGDDALPGREDPGRGLDGSRRADGRHLLRVARRQRAARSSRLVATPAEPSSGRSRTITICPVDDPLPLKPTWTSSTFLQYLGTGFALVSLASFFSVLQDEHGTWCLAGVSLLALVILLCLAAIAQRRGERIVAGLLGVVAILSWAVLVGSLLDIVGFDWLPDVADSGSSTPASRSGCCCWSSS